MGSVLCCLFSESFCLCRKLGGGKTSLGVFAGVTLMDRMSGVLEGLCDLVLS